VLLALHFGATTNKLDVEGDTYEPGGVRRRNIAGSKERRRDDGGLDAASYSDWQAAASIAGQLQANSAEPTDASPARNCEVGRRGMAVSESTAVSIRYDAEI